MRVAIIAQIRLYREGQAETLNRQRIEVVGAVANLESTVGCVARHRPDVLPVDTSMRDGAAGIRTLSREDPTVTVIALDAPETERDRPGCAEAASTGYVAHAGSLERAIEPLGRAPRGEVFCSPRTTSGLLRLVTEPAPRPGVAAQPLTAREREIVALIHDRMSNREIALQLCIALSTVRNHAHNLLEKLSSGRRVHAPALAGGDP